MLTTPPSEDDKQEESQQDDVKTEYTPATPPSEVEDKDAYENGIFVPQPGTNRDSAPIR